MVQETRKQTPINVSIEWTLEKERRRGKGFSKEHDLLTFEKIAEVMTAQGYPMSASLAFAIFKKAQRKIKKALCA